MSSEALNLEAGIAMAPLAPSRPSITMVIANRDYNLPCAAID